MTTVGTTPDPSSAQKRALLARLLAEGRGRADADDFVALFDRQARLTPDVTAVTDGIVALTYAELAEQASARAHVLRERGVGPGACVGLAVRRSPSALAALIGVAKAGAAWCPLEAEDAPLRLDRMREGLACTITDDGLEAAPGCREMAGAAAGAFAVIWPDVSPVSVPARAVAERLAWLRTVRPLAGTSRSRFAGSWHDTAFVTSLLYPLTRGATVDVEPGATGAAGALTDTAPASADVFWHVPEAGGPILLQPGDDGPSIPGAEVQILDGRGQPVPTGAVGDLYVRRPGGEALHPVGERARRRADGRIERRAGGVRRAGEGGLRISLRAIEETLAGLPGIAACRVLARRDDQGRERLVAYVVGSGEPALEAWRAGADEHLAPWQRPHDWVGVTNLALTQAGTVDEAALAELPVVDEDLARRCEAALSAAAGVAGAAVLLRPMTWPERNPVTVPLLPPRRDMPDRQAPPRDRGRPAALADGGPLTIATDAPRSMTEALLRTVERYPARGVLFVAADGTETRLSNADLLREATGIGAGLAAAGLRPGDRAILQLADVRRHLPAFWGCVLAGVQPVTVAVSPTFGERTALVAKLLAAWELLARPPIIAPVDIAAALHGLDRYGDAAPHVLAFEGLACAERLAAPQLATPHLAEPDDILFLQLSSGSTGTPKCIPITHRGVVAHIQGSREVAGYSAADVSLNWLPMDHVVPMLTWHLRDVYLGCEQVQASTADVLADPLRWLDLIERYQVTRSWAPNFGFKLVATALRRAPERRWNLASLKSLMNAGEQVTLAVCREFLHATAPFGVRAQVMQPAFGMAEACTCMTYEADFDPAHSVVWVDKHTLERDLDVVAGDARDAVAFVRLGPPMPGVAIRIADEDGAVLPERRIGRFQIKGSVITPGYLENAEANREAFAGGGWFNSGDLGFILDGRLVLTGRTKEMIVVNGANFYCFEIEDIVNTVDGVRPTFSAACSVPDAATGSEALAVFFVPREGTDAAIVADAIRTAVAARSGLAPAHVLPLAPEAFPKTTSGKIQRTQLRNALAARLETEAGAPTLPAWFHHELWVPSQAERPETMPRGVLLFASDRAAAAVEQLLTARGVPVWRVTGGPRFARLGPRRYALDPGSQTDHAALFADAGGPGGAVDRIVDLRWLATSTADADADALGRRAVSTFGAVLALLQASAACRRDLDIVVATRRGLAVAEDAVDPVAAGLRGLLRTAASEHPLLSCRQIDIDSAASEEGGWTWIADEIVGSRSEAECAWRQGRRVVPRLESIDAAVTGDDAVRLRWNGRYLVTGGHGAVGRQVVRHLLARCRAHILIVGREPCPADFASLWPPETATQVLYRQADVADDMAMAQAVAAAEELLGGPIEGAFHLAGTSAARSLAEETAAGLMEAFRPKAVGARVLNDLMGRRPGSFVVNWSSVNALFGATGAGAYALGNAALGERSAGVRSFTIHWSRWRDLGMSAAMGQDEFAAARGYRALSVAEALASLDGALAMGMPAVSIGLDEARPMIRSRSNTPPRALSELAGFAALRPGGRGAAGASVRDAFGVETSCRLTVLDVLPRTADGSVDRDALAGLVGAADAAGGASDTTDRLRAVWGDLLDRRGLKPSDNFFAVGGHSLAAARLVHKVRETFGVDLPLRILFEKPTLAGMAGWIDAQAPGDHAQLPECLVAIQPEGRSAPLFCVHPAGGSPWCYFHLAGHLGFDQPLYGFQAPGLLDASEPVGTVEELATLYVAAMRAVQPIGPYRIGAWSSGGPVAFEMACQLEAAGQSVALVAFFDCAVMETDNPMRTRNPANYAKGLWRIGGYLASVRVPRSYAELAALARLIGIELPAEPRKLRLGPTFWRNVGRALRLFNRNTVMGYRYRPTMMASPAVLFRAGASGASDALHSELDRYTSQPVTRVDLEGNHMSILLDPEGARRLAQQLAPYLADEPGRTRDAA
ncbi:SDR family NAD(P)-dependent oxidoreductase [Chelatococcus reniformis]|uniref:Carrier domain-containing protein n=1 Tax=Chelatococcus reniformis TaxID=1494448 RepID=A0A916X722_9HYPH|nr:SDR family NAD(P)-dependent oxidoreductase [Chelatococcus reniformis]GGC48539.1 hypothetical protein GCM10010994_04640 [Chelatococcus reniformis]